ncbi:DUF1684 domain-containing protein [Aquimarina mytili]|uniref:DUF1684 domain-containing protein n=1 Tax=Aquimarina mytili TaxID=874423 RepID=A0A936ZUE9_9FLAO|nr:DUF1684 domain-containing protein [Aquimarina mytili]MBL0684888.1 DUF1684 domain-containing protein [Aquimarina mytili]
MYRLFILSLFFFGNVLAQDSSDIKRILFFQNQLNKEFATEETSPLTPKDLKEFKSLDFFKIDTTFCVKAKFIQTPHETPFIMKTTNGSEPLYVKYGEAHFVLQERKWVLNIYQNQGLTTQLEYEDYLFLPFTDVTNGQTTYDGGRFIDLKIPGGDTILIDFNTAYNPYCAYNDRYSCPVPPEENNLEIKILAGVKKYAKHPENE